MAVAFTILFLFWSDQVCDGSVQICAHIQSYKHWHLSKYIHSVHINMRLLCCWTPVMLLLLLLSEGSRGRGISGEENIGIKI